MKKLLVEQYLVTVSGPDKPGITANLMKILSTQQITLSDMGQAVTHGLLSLSFVIETPTSSSIIKDLLFSAKKLGLTLDFKILDPSFKSPLEMQHEHFILSCVSAQKLQAHFIQDVANTLAQKKINILRIDNVTGKKFQALEITTSCPKKVNWKELKQKLFTLSNFHQVDMALIPQNLFRHNKRLIVFDMDSTLIQAEVVDEMAKLIGKEKEIEKLTHRAMAGEMDFKESLSRRVQILKGLPVTKISTLIPKLKLTPGTPEFLKVIKKCGYKTAIISGGFGHYVKPLQKKLGIDYAFCNELIIKNGKLTGLVKKPIQDAEGKALALKKLAHLEKISLDQVVAIGDGANDLPMLATAGLGIAFHAKELVKKQARFHLGHGPMTSLLFFLGIRE